MRIEARQMFRSNGLVDDLVVYAKPEEYISLAGHVESAMNSEKPVVMLTESDISIEIIRDEDDKELFTSLQNKSDEYFSMDEWNNRNILRVYGSADTLSNLHTFLIDLSERGEGYSYISEYSEDGGYSNNSPEWRLHVEIT